MIHLIISYEIFFSPYITDNLTCYSHFTPENHIIVLPIIYHIPLKVCPHTYFWLRYIDEIKRIRMMIVYMPQLVRFDEFHANHDGTNMMRCT